ncbi:MAG: type 11 methyltransferase [Herbinix sp.]|nr:type 11 methyltransferase [Herbinix sp.]
MSKHAEEVREFYNQYGAREWDRLNSTIYMRINFLLHMDFMKEYLVPGAKVLDAGCGAGRYAVEFARMGCEVTLFDISDEQLRIAKEKVDEANLSSSLNAVIQGDIRDLSMFQDDTFDVVICYGAPLSYIIEGRELAVKELARVAKPSGMVALSVNNKWGILKMLLGNQYPDFFNNKEYWYIDQVIETGDLPRHEQVSHPARHFFEAAELQALMSQAKLQDITLAGSPLFSCGNSNQVNEMGKDEKAYETILDIELRTYTNPTMVDNGEFLLAKARK